MSDAPTTDTHRPEPGAPRPVLRRCSHDRLLGGVAAGLGDYLGVDTTAVRVALVLLGLLAGVGVPAYLAAWLVIPEEGSDRSLAADLVERWSTR